MSVRRLLEKDVLIRLHENGFIETTRYFGLPKRSIIYETVEAESKGDTAGNTGTQFVYMPVKRENNRQPVDKMVDGPLD